MTDPFTEFLKVLAWISEQIVLLTLDLLCLVALLLSLAAPWLLCSTATILSRANTRRAYRVTCATQFGAMLLDLFVLPWAMLALLSPSQTCTVLCKLSWNKLCKDDYNFELRCRLCGAAALGLMDSIASPFVLIAVLTPTRTKLILNQLFSGEAEPFKQRIALAVGSYKALGDIITLPFGLIALCVPTRTAHVCRQTARLISADESLHGLWLREFCLALGDTVCSLCVLLLVGTLVRLYPTLSDLRAERERETEDTESRNPRYNSKYRGIILTNTMLLSIDVSLLPLLLLLLCTCYRIPPVLRLLRHGSGRMCEARCEMLQQGGLMLVDLLTLPLFLIVAISGVRAPPVFVQLCAQLQFRQQLNQEDVEISENEEIRDRAPTLGLREGDDLDAQESESVELEEVDLLNSQMPAADTNTVGVTQGSSGWTCAECTYQNEPKSEVCEMCNNLRDSMHNLHDGEMSTANGLQPQPMVEATEHTQEPPFECAGISNYHLTVLQQFGLLFCDLCLLPFILLVRLTCYRWSTLSSYTEESLWFHLTVLLESMAVLHDLLLLGPAASLLVLTYYRSAKVFNLCPQQPQTSWDEAWQQSWVTRADLWAEVGNLLLDIPFVFCGIATLCMLWRADLMIHDLRAAEDIPGKRAAAGKKTNTLH